MGSSSKMDSGYITFDQRLSQELESANHTDLLIWDAKPRINSTAQLSKKVKRVLSKSLKKFTSTVTQKSSQRKSRTEIERIVYGHGDDTGLTFCVVNAAFCNT